MKKTFLTWLLLPALALSLAQPAKAEQGATLKVELNAATDSKDGCRFTFVLNNAMADDLAKAGFELAFFDRDGLVERLTVLNFGKLPKGRTVVRQFDIAGPACAGYSRLLVNAVKTCEGPAGGEAACEAALSAGNRTNIEFGI